ncbi:lipocalin family protein [Myroides odoratus]|uniref:lipocalin family protein n=1 Tax=Myroides odoratus TaxID=256 RepID=UPI0039B01906
MKKILLAFGLMTLVLTGTVACSSDDNNSEQHQQTLVLASTIGTTVPLNEEVAFVVSVGTEVIEGTQIYVNGKQGKNPFKFTEKGEYKVIAKKGGYKDSNELTITVLESMVADNPIQGTWIPAHVNVSLPVGEPINMPYPNKENCETDTLVFDDGYSVKFNFHDASCAVSTTGSTWAFDATANVLNFTLFDQEMKVNVTSLTADKLVIKAKGDQFAALIPILVPDLASSLPPAMLALIEVELQFNRQ